MVQARVVLCVAFVENFAALEIDFYVIFRPSMVGDVRTTIRHIT